MGGSDFLGGRRLRKNQRKKGRKFWREKLEKRKEMRWFLAWRA